MHFEAAYIRLSIVIYLPPVEDRQATKEPGKSSYFGMFFLSAKRAKHFAAMVMIGDGMMALINPELDAKAWKKGPKVWRDLMHGLSQRPTLTRVIGVAQIAGGIYWALKQEEMD